MLRQTSRTGLLPVKLPHPIAAFTVFAFASLIYLGGVLDYNPALNFFKVNGSWRPGASYAGTGLAVIGALALLYLLRRAIHERAASKPGGIDITVISVSQRTDANASQIAAELRNALTDVHLSGPSVVPGESAPQDFLTEVRGAAEQTRSIWGIVVAAISLLSPRNVYRVSCTEQLNASTGAHGLTVEVAGLPRQEASVTTVWADNWPRVVRQAACHIAAYVLPRTKLSRRPPWTLWHGIKISRQLFYSFDEARQLARAGRLEEALHHFDDAMGRDPLNSYIRIERATVQDQLGLWIDALASYVDALTIESWFDRPVWKRYGRIFRDARTGGPSLLTKSPSGAAALLVARYRAVCSLAAAQRLAEQWAEKTSRTEIQPRRKSEANRAISRLRPLVTAYADLMMDAHHIDKNAAARKEVHKCLKENDIQVLRRVFQFAALEESVAIAHDYRWYRRRRWSRLPISQAAIRVLPIWSALQYHYVEHAYGLKKGAANFNQLQHRWRTRNGPKWLKGNPKYSIRWLKRINKQTKLCSTKAGPLDWPPEPKGVSYLLRSALGRQIPPFRFAAKHGWFTVKRGWHEHYNAACTFAVSMITPELHELWKNTTYLSNKRDAEEEKEKRDKRLVPLAINELSRAVVATDSQFAAGRSVWLRSGDHDLDCLRATDEYWAFVERYLPDTQPVRRDLLENLNPTTLVVSSHITQAVTTYSTLRGLFWREQAKKPAAEASELDAETGWWRVLHEVCENYWDWRTRWKLINKATILAERLSRFDPDMFAVTSAAVSDHRQVRPQNLSIVPGACQIGIRVNEVPRRLDRVTGSRLSDSSQFIKGISMSADYSIEKPIPRLDLLGELLSEPRLQRIEGTIVHALNGTSSDPRGGRRGRQLITCLTETWETIADWVACQDTFDGSTPYFELVTQGVRKLSRSESASLRLPGTPRRPVEP